MILAKKMPTRSVALHPQEVLHSRGDRTNQAVRSEVQGLVLARKRRAREHRVLLFQILDPVHGGYEGWAMFVDCDFLYLADIKELRDLMDDKYAVMCVQHDYAPKGTIKMDGAVQTVYQRKNWSSMVLYNCGHRKNRVLTLDAVSTQTGAFLHGFQWLEDSEIGSVPFVWNFLEGHYKLAEKDPTTSPKAIRYTRGGPWFEAWKNCQFADLWLKERGDLLLQPKPTTN